MTKPAQGILCRKFVAALALMIISAGLDVTRFHERHDKVNPTINE